MIRYTTGAAIALIIAGTTMGSAQEAAWTLHADAHADHLAFAPAGAQRFEMLSVEPLEQVPPVKNAPFSAEAVNEFTQMLSDGNRIERRYSTSLWRDSQGRTRREQEIALVGRLNVNGNPPRIVTIDDPMTHVSYTLDEQSKTASRQGAFHITTLRRAPESGMVISTEVTAGRGGGAAANRVIVAGPSGVFPAGRGVGASLSEPAKVESLGTRTIEGVEAEGTRTTTTIPAGAIGNVAPIDVVTERWFSKELQVAVMITRRDPQTGDTVYRLTNIVRAEPPADLFVVPADYTRR